VRIAHVKQSSILGRSSRMEPRQSLMAYRYFARIAVRAITETPPAPVFMIAGICCTQACVEVGICIPDYQTSTYVALLYGIQAPCQLLDQTTVKHMSTCPGVDRRLGFSGLYQLPTARMVCSLATSCRQRVWHVHFVARSIPSPSLEQSAGRSSARKHLLKRTCWKFSEYLQSDSRNGHPR
jgi:hypothetical protein